MEQQQDPFAQIFGGAKPKPTADPFAGIFGASNVPSPEPDLSSAKKQLEYEYRMLSEARDKLKALEPRNEGHKARLVKMINVIELQMADKSPDRSGVENFVRGAGSGFLSGLQFPVELAGNVMSLLGNKDLQNYIEENKAILKQEFDPEGKAGFAGEIAGGIISAAPGAGGAASLTGRGLIRLAPSSRIARAIAAGAEGTLGQRVATNVLTGLPVNVLQGLGGAEIEVPEGATPEEAERIRSMNVANKIKNLAIGIGADALFGAIPSRKVKPDVVEAKPTDVPLTPERQAQLDKVKAQTAVKAAAKRRERLDKTIAQSEWQILNPDVEWKELNGATRRKVYDDSRDRRKNRDAATPAQTGNTPDVQSQLVAMEENLKKMVEQRDVAQRLADTDEKLQIGNLRALEKAAKAADASPNYKYIFTDVNGLKDINDALGMEGGDKLMKDMRDVMIGAVDSYKVPVRVFRYTGGDELVAIVPTKHAQTILDLIEKNSIKKYGEKTGSMSGAIFDKLADAGSLQGKAQLTARKIEAKARQNIPGRSPEEQVLIDAARERINTAANDPALQQAPAQAAGVEPEYSVESPFPPEVMASISEIHAAGGLRTPEELTAFAKEVNTIFEKNLSPEERASELQALVEDFTPLEPESGTTAPPVAKAEASAAEARPAQTHIESIEHKKPLEEMSEKELGRLDDKVTDAIESVEEGSVEHQVIQRDFDAIHNEYARRNKLIPKTEQTTPEIKIPDYAKPPELTRAARAEEVPRVPEDVARLRRMSPRKMSDAELNTYIDDLEASRRESRDYDEAEDIQRRMNRAMEERAIRSKTAEGVVAEVPKGAIQGSAGFMFGFAVDPNAEDTSDRTTNGLMWAALALGAGFAVKRMAARGRVADAKLEPSDSWPGSDVAGKKIVNYEDVADKSVSWRERAREWYQGIVRRSYALDRAVNVMTGDKRSAASIAAHKNPAKLASMFGRWISMAEGALMDKPIYVDLQGNVVPLNAPSFREIIEMVGQDIRGLGKLMTARTSIEGRDVRSVPLDAVTSDLIFRNAPENYHKAADAMRQFDLAMAQVLEQAGVLQPGSVQNFALEEFYAGLKKVFDPDAGPSKIVRDPKTRKLVISQNPIKGRKNGTTTQVYNPAETTASMVPQVYRSAELNIIKNRLVDLWEASGKPDYILKQVERRNQPISVDQQLRIDALKQEVKGLSQADAEALVAAFDPKSLDPRSNVMTVYRDGVLRAYRVDEDIATAMTSLMPDELDGMWKMLGFPANIAKQGVVLNPYFVLKQSFIDGWQATLNSQYGFRPGVDQFIGWYNIVSRSPEYKKFVSAGGGHSTLQSHDYVNVKTALAAVKHGAGGPIETAVKQAKEFKLLDAWRTLIVPFAEAARVGEYLRARNHGAAVLDAVYAAKHVTANFQQRGGFTTMRGLDRASMFLNPAIQGLDQAMFRAGVNPFRVPEEGRKSAAAKYMSKAFVSITLPSMYFWFANKDDKEINDLRKTESGSKFWFTRSPVDLPKMGLKKGDIVKIPKPIVDGQMFGTSMEAYLDKRYVDDPAQVHTAAKAMGRDVAFNILPTAGVLYYGLQTNRNMAFGNPLVPPGDENLATAHQGEDRASWVARKVSQKVSSLVGPESAEVLKNAATPAGIDYIVTTIGGMLGQDAVMAVSQAVEAETKGYIPAKEELPIISKIFAGYPSSNVMPLRRFYERAEQVQTVGATIDHLVREDPERLLTYMGSNQADYVMVGMFAKARQDIANYRRAYQDVKEMSSESISTEDRRNMMKQYQILMIESARQVNAFSTEIDRSVKGKK